jgi:hypothetical protein
MQCKDIELVLEQEGLEPLPEEARAHLAECVECRNYVADLTSIVDGAHKLPAEIAPPERVWISLRAQLEAEGIIHTPADPVSAPSGSWWESLGAFFSNRVFATATVGILITAAVVFVVRKDKAIQDSQHSIAEVNPASQPVSANPPLNRDTTSLSAPTTGQTPPAEFASTAQALSDQEPVATGMIASSNSTVDASLRDNLKKVNEFIADCERHLKEQPQDELTREYLSAAYEQKAELLSAIIERGRSVN